VPGVLVGTAVPGVLVGLVVAEDGTAEAGAEVVSAVEGAEAACGGVSLPRRDSRNPASRISRSKGSRSHSSFFRDLLLSSPTGRAPRWVPVLGTRLAMIFFTGDEWIGPRERTRTTPGALSGRLSTVWVAR